MSKVDTIYSSSLDSSEPLCTEIKNRFVLFPIQNQEIWSMYKKHVASFWTAEEIDLTQDHKDWVTLSSQEQHFIKYVLAFFAASDGIVLENLTSKPASCYSFRSFFGKPYSFNKNLKFKNS